MCRCLDDNLFILRSEDLVTKFRLDIMELCVPQGRSMEFRGGLDSPTGSRLYEYEY